MKLLKQLIEKRNLPNNLNDDDLVKGCLVVKDLPFALLITYFVVGFTPVLLGYTKGKLTNQNVISTIIEKF